MHVFLEYRLAMGTSSEVDQSNQVFSGRYIRTLDNVIANQLDHVATSSSVKPWIFEIMVCFLLTDHVTPPEPQPNPDTLFP